MNCVEARSRLIEVVRSGAGPARDLKAHVEGCEACSCFLAEQRRLESALAVLAEESAPPDLDARLLAELNRAVAKRRRRLLVPALCALAATVTIAAVMLQRPPLPPSRVDTTDAPFVQVPYVIPAAPYERTQVLRMNMSAAGLVSAGFRVVVPDYAATVPVDVLVGQDGRTLAIRLLPGGDSIRRANQ